MKIVTSTEMREIDRVTTDRYGVSSLTLMENAGNAVARFALRQYPGARRLTVICGKGNNGGDGLAAARMLHRAGKEVTVLLLAHPQDVRGDAAEMLKRLPLPLTAVTSPEQASSITSLITQADLLLDAIFGTGFHPPLPQLAANVLDMIRQSSTDVISIDLPSGADADSCLVEQPQACRSSAVVTFTAPKPALIFGALTRGPIVVAPIGSPDEAITSNTGLEWNRPPDMLRIPRQLNSNKGLYGHALIVGGSVGKSGAPAMAAMAALRIGAGLVTAAVVRSVLPMVGAAIPELMTEPLDENAGGALSEHAFDRAESEALLHRKNVVALGPGLGGDPDTLKAVSSLVERCPLPLVLDADGLNAFAAKAKQLDGTKHPLVLTPHPGEMARLLGSTVPEIEGNRVDVVRRFAREHHVILVLKGWRTLISCPEGRIWVNTTGNPGLAKGGSGDALTGMIAGLIAQHKDCILDSVRGAVYLHGLAADFAVQGQAEETLLATDVIARLSQAILRVRESPLDEFVWIQGEAQQR